MYVFFTFSSISPSLYVFWRVYSTPWAAPSTGYRDPWESAQINELKILLPCDPSHHTPNDENNFSQVFSVPSIPILLSFFFHSGRHLVVEKEDG
jgi:hypothetical protein